LLTAALARHSSGIRWITEPVELKATPVGCIWCRSAAVGCNGNGQQAGQPFWLYQSQSSLALPIWPPRIIHTWPINHRTMREEAAMLLLLGRRKLWQVCRLRRLRDGVL